MKKIQLLFFLCTLIPFILTDTEFVATTIIDDFEVSSDVLRVVVPFNGELPRQATLETQGPNILGGERDLILVAESGTPESLISTGVNNGVWTSTSPSTCSGFSSLQYDGPEGSTSVSKAGLNCTNITAGGATQFLIEAASNNPTDIKLFVYDSQERQTSLRLSVAPSNAPVQYFLNFTAFPGSFDFSCVGAIELTATILNNAQFYVSNFAVGSQIPITPTPTPSSGISPSHTPSKSSTHTQTAFPSLTILGPTISPSTSPSPYEVLPSASSTPSKVLPSHTPSPVYQCSTSDDCAFLNNGCLLGYCAHITNNQGTCAIGSCPLECGMCNTEEQRCVCPNEDSSEPQSGTSIGLIVGPVVAGVVLCFICFFIVAGFVVYKKKQASSVSVYDTMIGDM